MPGPEFNYDPMVHDAALRMNAEHLDVDVCSFRHRASAMLPFVSVYNMVAHIPQM